MFQLKRSKADKLFSLYIRHRDKWTCQNCQVQVDPPTNYFDSAHLHSRSKKSVRFDEENAICLCKKCHVYFDGHSQWKLDPHREELRVLFRKRLGQNKYDLLEMRASTLQKVDEKLIELQYILKLEEMGFKSPKYISKGCIIE